MSNHGPDDLVFGAYVEDHTDEFFSLFDARVEEAADNAKDAFEQIDGALGGTEGSVEDVVAGFRTGVAEIDDVLMLLEGSIGGVSVATLAMSAVAVLALMAVKRAIKLLIIKTRALAQPTHEAEVAMEHLAEIHGIASTEIEETRDMLHSMGLTAEESARSIVELIRADIKLVDAKKLIVRAANIAASTGQELTTVHRGMINAIKEENVEALKQYDIFINAEQAYSDYAKSIGKSAIALTDLDRRNALLAATLEDVDRHMGAFEAAQGTITGQSEDLARKLNELKIQFGLAFQESQVEILQIQNDKLEKMIDWVMKNQDTWEDWATVGGNVMVKLAETTAKLTDVLIWLFEIPERMKAGTAQAIHEAFNIPEDEIIARIDGIGVAWRQLVSIIVGSAQTAVDVIMIFANQTVDGMATLHKASVEFAKGNFEEGIQLFKEFGERAKERLGDGDFGGLISDKFSQNIAEMGELLNIMEDVESEAGQVDAAFAGAGDAALHMAATVQEASKAFGDLFETYQQEIARAGVEATRRQIENQLRTTHRLQDITRNYNQRMSDALEGANEDRKQALEGHNEERIDILRDYHRRVEDIQQEFNRNAHELARKRDAVGLMELIRNNKYKLDEEKESRDERISDQDRLFRLELKHIQRRKQEEIEAIQERRQAEIESLKRSLSRQREFETLHRQWQVEDRQEKYRQRLADMVEHYVQEEGLTYEHLQNMLNQWGSYFTGLNEMLASMMVISAGGGGGAAPLSWEDLMRLKQQESGVIGQAGLISAMLPPDRGFNIPKDAGRGVSRIPEVYPGRSDGGSRDINVNVSGDALDPIIQRELVRSLLEIERNRS